MFPTVATVNKGYKVLAIPGMDLWVRWTKHKRLCHIEHVRAVIKLEINLIDLKKKKFDIKLIQSEDLVIVV